MSETVEAIKKVVKIPEISKEQMSYFQKCSDGVVARHHMCGGCLKGQFYCDIFEKWRDHWHQENR